MLTPAQAAGVTRGVLAVSFAILAVFNILPGAEASWSAWLSDHPVLGDISNQLRDAMITANAVSDQAQDDTSPNHPPPGGHQAA